MRLKRIFIAGFIFFQFGLFLPIHQLCAQTCNEDMILNKKGSWKKTSDANMKAGNQSQAISRMDKMQKIVQAAYPDSRGIEARWYRSMINNPLAVNGPIPYQVIAAYYIYYCLSEKEMVLGDETATWSYVYVNHFNWFMQYDFNFTVKKNPVYLMPKKMGELNGYPVYEGIQTGTSNTGTYYSRSIIITRPGQSPYMPVTRKQYLMLYLKRYELEKAKQIPLMENLPVKSDAEEEANKQKGLERIEKTTSADKREKAKSSYLRGYVTDKQRKEEDLKNLNKMYETSMKTAQDLLNSMSKEEAGMPAIVSGDYVSKFEQFSTEEKGGRMLVRLNPDYFNSKLPKYVPQFLIVYWRWEKNKASEKFKDQFEANFNFDALKDMLDK